MSFVDELIFTLAISVIVTTIIIRLFQALAPEKPASPKQSSSSSAFCRTEPANNASAAGESHSPRSVIKLSASPAVSLGLNRFAGVTTVAIQAAPAGESPETLIKQASAPAKTVTEQGAALASREEKADPDPIYRVDSLGSARDFSGEEAKQPELGESTARELGNPHYYGELEVGSSCDAATGIGSSALSAEEDKTAVINEAAAAPSLGADNVIIQQILLINPSGVDDHTAEDQVVDESPKRDNINIGDDLIEGRTELRETEIESTKGVGRIEEISVLEREDNDHKAEDQVVDESPKRDNINIGDDLIEGRTELPETEIESTIDVGRIEEIRVLEREDNEWDEGDAGEINENVGDNGSEGEELIDDWEGIERTELEKCFGEAVAFVGSPSNAGCISRLNYDTKMRLYGLHKVAIEGTCLVPQPMALKVTARANWNAWQVLGDMSRETAMEQYISLLSSSVPSWIEDGAKEVLLDSESSPTPPTESLEALVIENQSLPEELEPPSKGHVMIGAV